MKIIYTKHAEEKLLTRESKKFLITKNKIEMVIRKPVIKELLLINVTRSIGSLDKSHSLCVVYREENGTIKVITFFPAEKGRYESKILS